MSTTPKKAAPKATAAKKAATVKGAAAEAALTGLAAKKAADAAKTAQADANLAKMKAADIDAIAAMNKLELTSTASKELAAKKAALAAKKPAPPTPVLDYLNSTEFRQRQTFGTTRKSSGAKAIVEQTVNFFRNGKPMGEASNRLSCIAYQCTRGVAGEGSARITTDELRSLLAKQGITEPSTTAWKVTLPNGVTIQAVRKGDAAPALVSAPKKAPAAKATKKPAAKKATAKKAPATAKAIGKQAAAQKAVSNRRAAKRAS